jgi:Uma2 family endonuclease
MSTAPSRILTPAEYLARERAAEFKSEFYRGEMFAMSGANGRHVRICVNLLRRLDEKLENKPCAPFNSDMRVKVTETGLYTYPDASIACGDIQFEDASQDVLLNPKIIFEVLSKSTERRDRGWKFDQYTKLTTMAEYVLVSQEQSLIERFVRQQDGNWMLERLNNLDSSLKLDSVEIELPLHQVYSGIAFGPEDDRPPTVLPP